MRLAALWFIAACAYWTSPPRQDAPIDRFETIDAPADAPADAACNMQSVVQDIYSCGCCGEGASMCVDVVVDQGSIVDIVASAMQPATPDVLACVKARAVGRCYDEVSMTVCAAGF